MGKTKQKVRMFMDGAIPGITGVVIDRVAGGSAGSIDRELAEEYGRIAERMRKDGYVPREEPETKEEPETGEPWEPRERKRTEETLAACYSCSWEHLGEAKNCIEHASGREPGSKEYDAKIERAVDKLLEVEREHLGPKDTANARKIRLIRKAVESHIGPGGPEKSLAGIIEDIDQIRPTMKRLWLESSEEEREEPGILERADKDTLTHLERFEETGDVAHLEKARETSAMLGCRACTGYIKAAIQAVEEGKMDEAREWVRGVKTGIQVSWSKG